MQLLRSLLFAAIFYPGTLMFVLAGITASLAGDAPMQTVVRGWSAFHARWTRTLLGIRIRVEGEIPPGPHLVAVKHQAMFETIEMVRLGNCPIIVIKRELAFLPLFGWLTRRYGVLPVDRQAGPKALRALLAGARQALASGRSVVIYPEGTRVPPGTTPPLQAGFAGLYRALALPVLPIAVDSGRVWGRKVLKRPGTITFRIGEPIPTGLSREEIERRVHAAINALEPSGP
jgi:1-acyl-sn-glycerol-3-phosphate acyltransferase